MDAKNRPETTMRGYPILLEASELLAGLAFGHDRSAEKEGESCTVVIVVHTRENGGYDAHVQCVSPFAAEWQKLRGVMTCDGEPVRSGTFNQRGVLLLQDIPAGALTVVVSTTVVDLPPVVGDGPVERTSGDGRMMVLSGGGLTRAVSNTSDLVGRAVMAVGFGPAGTVDYYKRIPMQGVSAEPGDMDHETAVHATRFILWPKSLPTGDQ